MDTRTVTSGANFGSEFDPAGGITTARMQEPEQRRERLPREARLLNQARPSISSILIDVTFWGSSSEPEGRNHFSRRVLREIDKYSFKQANFRTAVNCVIHDDDCGVFPL